MCGDGSRRYAEGCDDGGTVDGDGCSSDCSVECGFTCELGSTGGGDACHTICGDGLIAGDEACDDGNIDSGDGCSSKCEDVETDFTCSDEDSAHATCPELSKSSCSSIGNSNVSGVVVWWRWFWRRIRAFFRWLRW